MRLAWENMMLNFHHDSIGGTHIDGGYDELMDFLDESESIAMEFARPVKKSDGQTDWERMHTKGKNVKKLGDLTVIYDQTGILKVLKADVDVFGDYRLDKLAYNSAVSRPVRIGELALMDDWGKRLQLVPAFLNPCFSGITTTQLWKPKMAFGGGAGGMLEILGQDGLSGMSV